MDRHHHHHHPRHHPHDHLYTACRWLTTEKSVDTMERVNCESKEELMEKHNIRLYGPRVQAEWVLSLSSCSLSSSPPSSSRESFIDHDHAQQYLAEFWSSSLEERKALTLWMLWIYGKRKAWGGREKPGERRALTYKTKNKDIRSNFLFTCMHITFAHIVHVCKIFVHVLN